MATYEELATEMKELKASLKAMDEDNDKEKSKDAKKASLLLAMEHMDDKQKDAMRAAIKASDDEDMKKAMDEIPEKKKDAAEDEEDKPKEAKSKKASDVEMDAIKAELKALRASEKNMRIEKLVDAYKAVDRFDDVQITAFKASLSTMTNDELTKTEGTVAPMLAALKASEESDDEMDWAHQGSAKKLDASDSTYTGETNANEIFGGVM